MTRDRIIAATSTLIDSRGIAAATLDAIKRAAEVSSSQIYDHFASKEDLMTAVLEKKGIATLAAHQAANLTSSQGLRTWMSAVVDDALVPSGTDACSIGRLASQLADTDEDSRRVVDTYLSSWAAALRQDMTSLHELRRLRADINPDDLADSLIVTILGGIVTTRVCGNTRSMQCALAMLIDRAIIDLPADREQLSGVDVP